MTRATTKEAAVEVKVDDEIKRAKAAESSTSSSLENHKNEMKISNASLEKTISTNKSETDVTVVTLRDALNGFSESIKTSTSASDIATAGGVLYKDIRGLFDG